MGRGRDQAFGEGRAPMTDQEIISASLGLLSGVFLYVIKRAAEAAKEQRRETVEIQMGLLTAQKDAVKQQMEMAERQRAELEGLKRDLLGQIDKANGELRDSLALQLKPLQDRIDANEKDVARLKRENEDIRLRLDRLSFSARSDGKDP